MLRMLTALAALLLLGAAGCARTADPDAPAPPSQTTSWTVIVDADAHGAIVLDGDQAYRGVRRDGTTAWRRPAGEQAPMAVACAARCPDAVLSGSVQSFTNPGVPDPRPELIIGGRAHPLAGVVAELAQQDGRPRARVRAFDARGAVVWRRDLPAEVAVTADRTASRAAYLAEGTLQELDLRTGQASPPLPGVLAARYDGAGGLVTVGADRALTWRGPAGH